MLDARDEVALARDDVARAAPVPGHAVVEDVAEAVPLGRALQRHRDDVVRSADAVREALVAALGVDAGVGHRVHRVGAAAPPLLRSVRVERLRERDHAALGHERRGLDPLGGVDEVQRAEHVVLAPAAPVAEGLGARGDLALGVGAVEVGGVLGLGVVIEPRRRSGRPGCRGPAIDPVMTSPSRRNRFQCWPLPAGLPVSRMSPGSSGMVCEAPEMSAGMSNSRSLVEASCITWPLSSSRTFRSIAVDERRRHEERAGRQEPGRVLGAVPVGADLLHVLAEDEVARRDVVDDRVAGDVVQRVLARQTRNASRPITTASSSSQSCTSLYGGSTSGTSSPTTHAGSPMKK